MRKNYLSFAAGCLIAALVTCAVFAQQPQPRRTTLRFEVTVAAGLAPDGTDGRVLVVLGRQANPEPRLSLNHYQEVVAVLGADGVGWQPGQAIALDQASVLYPLAHLAQLPAGTYAVQAVVMRQRDLCLVNAPGNLYSTPVMAKLDPSLGGTLRLELTRAMPADALPAETADVKYVKLRSELLSRFHGRPMFLRAAVLLPRDFAREPERRYPLRVHIGGYGSRCTRAADLMARGSAFRAAWLAADAPRMLLLHLDGAGPFGDPYQVNSANNGPYGDAVVRELIPHVERKYRGSGAAHARVLDGASTGGWVSLALQIFYPDFFGGAWSRAPDPLDFRAFELIDVYKDANAYVNKHGFERPASRDLSGDVRSTMRYECQLERVLGRGDRWELSGLDWCAWNAVFGPRGIDGLPQPLWDGRTGKLDRAVVEHWQRYDLRMVLEKNWAALAPRLRGKLHIAVGEADEYFLNNAVHLLDGFLRSARPAYEGSIDYAMGRGHDWAPRTEAELMRAMDRAITAGAPRVK